MAAMILDLLVLAVITLFFILGWRKGLLLSLCGLAVMVAALIGAGLLADALDTPIAHAIEPKLAEAVQEQFQLHHDDRRAIDPVDTLREMGGVYNWMADALEKSGSTLDAVKTDTAEELAHEAARLIATQVIHHLIFAAAFLILVILLHLLLRAMDLVAKLPGLEFCNHVGGGLLGLVKGFVTVIVAALVIRVFSYSLPEGSENSYTLRFLAQIPALIPHF